MTVCNMTPGASNGQLGVCLTASMPPAIEDVRELKTCERCGVQFTRTLLTRVRDCPRCVAKTKARDDREAAEEVAWRAKRAEHEETQRKAMELRAAKRVGGKPLREYNRLANQRYREKQRAGRTASLGGAQ